MENLLEKNYAERIKDSIEPQEGLVWYLPHHPVINPQKPEKTRVVYDCSAKYDGVSLNSNLLPGPDLTNSLVGVLLRFRQSKIGMMSDIEAMFHQVNVKPSHRNVLSTCGGQMEI